MSSPSDFETFYRQFASLTHYPVEQFKVFKSSFPLLQNVACRHMKQLPPDVPFWNSAIPFLCVLGKAKQESFSNPDATNMLIALNTLHLITHVLKANSFFDIDQSDTEDVINLLHILADIIEKFKEPISDKKAHLNQICEGIHKLSDMIQQRSEDNEEFLRVLKKVIRNTKKCTHFIRGLFQCVFFNTDYEELIPLVMQFFLDVQTVGVFECLADRYSEFAFNENQLLEGFRLLFIGQQDQAHKIFLDQSERYKADAQKLLTQGRMPMFCAAASKAAGVSAFELSKGSDDANVMRYYQSFVLPEYQTVPYEFSSTIINLLNMITMKTPNREVTQQLAGSLDSYTTDQQLKYICSAAVYFPDTELGYVALMGAYLPVPLAQRIAHLEALSQIISQAYIITDAETRNYIKSLNVELPNAVSEIFNANGDVKTLAEAEQSFAIILSISQTISEQGRADQAFLNYTTNLNHLLCAWIISIASALQAATITFVPNAIATIEKNRCIKQDRLDQIHQAYDVVCQISLYMATPTVINDLITNVSKSMLSILPLIDDLIEDAPISLVDSEKEFAALLEFSEIAIRLFEQLQAATVRVDFKSPIYLRHQVISIISPIYGQIQAIPQTLQTQPESITQLISEVRMLLTSYLNLLYNVDRSVDIKALTEEFTKLTTSNDPTIICESIKSIESQLSMISTQANQVEVSPEILEKINIKNDQDVGTLIQMITNPLLQAASYDLIKVVDEIDTTHTGQARTELRDQILNLITLRINGYQQLDLTRILALSDEDLRKNSLEIYASLPLYAGVYTHQVQELAVPLLLQKDTNEMREALTKIVTHLTITLPLQEALRNDIAKFLSDPSCDFSADLEALARSLQLNVFLSQVDDTRLRSLFDAASLYSYTAKPVFSDEYVVQTADMIFMTRDAAQIQQYTTSLVTNLILTSVNNGHFCERTLYQAKVLLKAAADYAANPTDANHRAVYGATLQLPQVSSLEKTGQMDETYLQLVAHSLKTNQNIAEEDVIAFYNAVNPTSTTLYDTLMTVSDLVPVVQHRKDSAKLRKLKKPPQIVRRIIKQAHPPPPVHVHKIIKHIVKIRRHVQQTDTTTSLTANMQHTALIDAELVDDVTNINSSVSLNDGSIVNADGSIVKTDGTIVRPDGSVIAADGTIITPATVVVGTTDGSSPGRPAGLPPAPPGAQGGKLASATTSNIALSGKGHQRSASALFNAKTGEENQSLLRCAKIVESARGARDCVISLKRAIEDNSPNIKPILDQYKKYSSYLSSLLSESRDSTNESLNKSLIETSTNVQNVVLAESKDAPEELNGYSKVINKITRDCVFLCLQALGVTNNAQAELSLMTSNIDNLQTQLDDTLIAPEVDMGPLQKRVASSARELFKLTRQLGLEARAQTEFLTRSNQSVTDEKGLIKAALQTSDAAQMFFLLLKLFAMNDPDIKYKVVAACKGMRVALTNIIVNLRAKGGSNEIAKRIESLSEQIFGILQYILELAEELINQESTIVRPANQRTGLSLIVQRRNADAEVFKKRRALEEAENEIKRLNRAAAKTRGGS
ncbi:hypothetical protein TRFO_06584 [Tritrichomonas foetus]|uniref:I/LWEQ domain-containing protein n=1 Tax=Tritrichomonas foetus TaxID=1144522 RepID=A0A1J4JX69_9EUKA|nr:hypothetical protein TRFO_06584 [Tritrichomonas foetus]|eukprot:OHT03745.1 hypothetical protein TRFO_06584 [Tritrichomonas foetus]